MVVALLGSIREMSAMPPTAIGEAALVVPVFAAIMLGSTFVASLAGFGGGLLALPLTAWVCGDLGLAVIILLLLGTVQAGVMAVFSAQHIQWRCLGSLLGWSALGVPCGLLLANWLPSHWMVAFMGTVVLCGGIAGLSTARSEDVTRPLGWRDRLLLFAGGIMHGAAGCGGPTVVVAARHVLPAKVAFRSTLFAFWVFLNAFALAGLGSRLTSEALTLLIVGIPCVLLGNQAGEWAVRRITQRSFGKIVGILLITMGLVTLGRLLIRT